MAGFERLVVKIDGDGKGLTAELQRVGGSVSNFTNKVNRASKDLNMLRRRQAGMVAAFRDVVVSLSSVQTLFYQAQFYAGGFIKKLVDANAQYERMTVLLGGLSKASTAAGREMEAKGNLAFVRQMAKEAPFDLQTIADSFVRLKTIGIDPTNGSLKALSDSVAAFGGDSNILKRATVAIQQMAGKGVISMEELRQQLGEAVPNAVALMARSVRMNYQEFVKLVSQGKVKAGPALEAFFREAERVYGGSAARLMNTYTGLMQRLSTSFTEFALKVNESPSGNGFFDQLKKNLDELTIFLSSARGATLARDLGESLAYIATKLADLIKLIYEYRKEIAAAGKVFLTIFAGRAIIGSVAALTGAIGGLIGTVARYSSILMGLGSNKRKLIGIVANLTSNFNVLGFKINGASVAARGLITRAVIMGTRFAGLIGIVAGLTYGVIKLAQSFDKAAAARRNLANVEKMAKTGDIPDEETLEDLKAQRDGLAGQIKRDEQRLAAIEKRRRNNGGKYTLEDMTSKHILEERMKVNKSSYAKFARDYATIDANYNADIEARTVSSWQATQQRATDARVQTLRSSYQRIATALDERRSKLAANDKAGHAELAAQQEKDEKEFNTKLQNIYRERANQILTKGKQEGGLALKAAKQAATDLREQANALSQQQPIDLTDLIMPGSKKKKTGKTEAEKEVDKIARKIETYRSRWVQLKIESDRLAYELANGNSEGFISDDSQDAAEEAVNGIITSIDSGKKAINDLRDANRKAHDDIKKKNVLTELSGDLKNEKDKVTDLFQAYVTGFETVGLKVGQYRRSLMDRYGDSFREFQDDAAHIQELNDKIDASVEAYRQEVLINSATEIKERNRELIQGLMTEDQVREDNYQREVARVQNLIASLSAKGELEGRLAKDLNQYLTNLERDKRLKETGPFGQWALDARDLGRNIQENITNSFTGMFDQLEQGSLKFKEFGLSVVKSLVAIIAKAYIAKILLNALGFGSGITSASTGGFNVGGIDTGMQFNLNHTGGIAGKESSGMRTADARIFQFAKRYHSGGFPGLRSDEVPIIAQRGEGIFTKEQMKALGSGMPAGGGAMPEINIINQTGTPVTKEQTAPRFDGEKYIVDVVLKNVSKPGPMRDAFMSGGR